MEKWLWTKVVSKLYNSVEKEKLIVKISYVISSLMSNFED